MGGALRVLLVEDSPVQAGRVLQELARGGLRVKATRVATPPSLRKALQESRWDLVLAAANLPAFDELGALEILRAAGLDLPFIPIATSAPEEGDRAGKDPFGHLVPAVERELREAEQRRLRAEGEEAINTSNYRLRIILDSLVEGVAQFDRSGCLQATNASARNLLANASLEELERRSCDSEGQPWPAGAHPVTRALKRGLACTGVVLGIRKPEGALLWFALNATPLLYRSREPWGVVVSFTEITGERQSQRQREVLADLLQMAHQTADATKLAKDMANRLALWSGCAAVGIHIQEGVNHRMHGSQSFPASFAGAHIRKEPFLCKQVSRQRRRPGADAALLAELKRLGFESAALLPVPLGEQRQGLWLFLDPRAGCFEDLPEAALQEVAGIAANVLAKALAEQALRERAEALARSRAMLAQAQALAGLGSWELDLVTDQRTWSPETYLHWDCDPALPCPALEELLRKVHPEDLETFQAFHRTLASAKFPLELEFRVLTDSGATRYLYTQAIPLCGPTEPPGRIQGAVMDITSRKLSELALRDMEKLSAKGQMAAYIAHEINNPLAGIRNAFLLLEGSIPKDHPHRSYVPLITREIDRIGSIIRTMYHLYRPDPGAGRKVVLEEVFYDLERLLAPKCLAHGARIAIDLTGMREDGTVNEGLFRQVLFNLIQNALEASPSGGVVTVAARSAQERLEVSVGDEGPGIAPELAERIFQPGFTTKRDTEMSGLGLGLATCRSLAATMGGTLAFQNRPEGPGTIFTLEVPFGLPRSLAT